MVNYYVTTSIPYVNSDPHIGFAMELIMADVLARLARSQGRPVIFTTGSDEHGGKIAERAAELKLKPEELATQNSQKFRDLGKLLNISNDRFVRTTDVGHIQRAQLIWKKLAKDIYKGTYVGLYCVGCETYVTEAVAKANNGVCPDHKRPYEKLEEDNYFFRLSAYGEQIKTAINDGSFRVIPETRKHEILNVITEGLEDISVSRPKKKITWGIPVPDDTTQVMYVWFEALMYYLSGLGYPEHDDFKKYWPANVQVIGKDIIRQHAAIWPGLLLGLGLPLPSALYVHGHINVGGTKMSKSLGNVVSPSQVVTKFGVDAFRYFMLRHIPSYDDGDFTWERFETAYNNELANELGNAVQRTVVMIQKYQNGVIGDIPPAEHDSSAYFTAIEDCHFDRALDEVWEQVRGLNQYIDEEKPWVIANPPDGGKDEDHLREVLAYQASCLLEIAELLKPFMPESSEKIQKIFGEGVIRATSETLFPKQDATTTPPTSA